jgi:DNA polymerase-3 subunit gamma/tau
MLYRKWRPQTFAEVAGQTHVTRTLANAVSAGTVAHAYLFCGPRGTGKTSTARILAKAVNCASPVDGNPCDGCDFCQGVRQGSALDLVEMDAASNRGIDDIRELREKAAHAPVGARFKVYLLDEAHMLTPQASNALLKTLEEPPPYIIFILATTNPQDMLSTIVSRCQRFDFRRITIADIVERLQHICTEEGFEFPPQSLELIARQATGSLRDANNLLEMTVSHYGASPTPEQVEAALGLTGDPRARELAHQALRADVKAALQTIAAVRDDGVDLVLFQKETVHELRMGLLAKSGALPPGALSEAEAATLNELVRAVPENRLFRAVKAFAEADLKAEPHSPLPLELAVLESARDEAVSVPQPAVSSQAGPSRQVAGGRQPQTVPRRAPARPTAGSGRAGEDGPARIPVQSGAQQRPSTPSQGPQGEPQAPTEEQRVHAAICSAAKGVESPLGKQVGGLLNGGHVVSVESERLVIGFPYPMHVEMARRPDWAKIAGDAAAHVLGRPVAIEFVQSDARSQARAPRGGHLARAAEEMGARPVRSQRPEQPPRDLQED